MNSAKRFAQLAVIALALAPMLAIADGDSEGGHVGYVGGSIGTGTYNQNHCVGNFTCDTNTTSFKVFSGMKLSPHNALELGYVNFGNVNQNSGTAKAQGIDLSWVGSIPVAEHFKLFGTVGAVYGWTVTDSSLANVHTGDGYGVNVSYGVGAQYQLNRAWALQADWTQYRLKFTPGDDSISVAALGAVYKY